MQVLKAKQLIRVIPLTSQQFDDIETTLGKAFLPASYSHLSFSEFEVFAPRDPALDYWLPPHDKNCATSSPNALLGSSYNGDGSPASFSIANATAMKEAQLHPYFTLQSFQIKPLSAPPPGTVIHVLGWSHAHKMPLKWHVDFDCEYHLPLLVKLEEFAREEWTELYKVEIHADFGYDGMDYEFCLDDLQVRFFRDETANNDVYPGLVPNQVVLG